MTNPLFWLVLSLLFVTVSLTIVLIVAIPTLRELSRAARSAEKLFETLRREFPPTLEAIRLTGMEISDLTDDLHEGVQSAGQVVKQVDQTLGNARRQARKVQHGTRSLAAGLKSAWKTLTRPQPSRRLERLNAETTGTPTGELPASPLPPIPEPLADHQGAIAEPEFDPITDYPVPPNPRVSPTSGTRFISKSGELVEEIPRATDDEMRPNPATGKSANLREEPFER